MGLKTQLTENMNLLSHSDIACDVYRFSDMLNGRDMSPGKPSLGREFMLAPLMPLGVMTGMLNIQYSKQNDGMLTTRWPTHLNS